jgi:hypothetical protein
MVPETFHCIKDKNGNRDIHKLEHDGQTILDPDEIIDAMQKWNERTAERLVPQAESLSDFLLRHHLTVS